MKPATLIPLVISAAGAMPALEKKSDIAERQIAEIIEVLIFEGIKLGTNSFVPGPEKPLCAPGGGQEGDYWLRAYKTVDGKNVTIGDMCWKNGGYKPTLGDTVAAKCLLGLHQNQANTCIDLVGSSCESVEGTGVGNVKVYSGWSGDSNQQPDQYNIDRMGAIFGKIVNIPGLDLGDVITVNPSNDDGTSTTWTAVIRSTGAADC